MKTSSEKEKKLETVLRRLGDLNLNTNLKENLQNLGHQKNQLEIEKKELEAKYYELQQNYEKLKSKIEELNSQKKTEIKKELEFSDKIDEDTIIESALEAGAEDVITNNDKSVDIITNADNLVDVKEAILAAGFEPENAEITMRASTMCELDKKGSDTMIKLLDALDDLDDVQKIYSNAEIPDEILAELN